MSWLPVHFETVLVTLLVLVATITILQQRRTPQSAAAWILFIIVIPYLAIPLFMVLGFRKRHGRFGPITFGDGGTAAITTSLSRIFEAYGLPGATKGNRLRLLTVPEQTFAELIELCQSAKRTLDAQFYVVADDPVGRAFVTELTARAAAGVRVRLLMDRLGSLRPPHDVLEALKAAGGRVLYFSPILRLPERGHFNLRNHRKMVIADGARVFSGGMNVANEYMGPPELPGRWSDLAFLIEGPAVSTFRDTFRSDWSTARGSEVPEEALAAAADPGKAVVQLVPSGPDIKGDPLHDVLENAIHRATSRVWIATPYFLPTEFLSNALAIAARRRVDVRILLPRKSNQHLANFARGAYLREVQDAGCTILFYEKGMMHAKAGIIDDAAYVGSANFDIRSMLLNFETALFVYDDASVEALADWFAQQERHCRIGVGRGSLPRRIAEGLFRLGAPVL